MADRLLGAMATVRRAVRRLPERPEPPEPPEPLCTLTAAQGELVRLVRWRPGVSVAEAAEELRLAPNTVSTLVGQLTDQGLLLRVADQADRRVARLDLDPDARRKVTAWRDRRSEAVAAAMGRLGADDRRVLADAAAALERLAEAVHREVVHRAAEEAG
ncbi:MAG TPA: MarR family transcriptional regulator [Acidimicrobiales bacterium]|nr:MarR family transcriptional regulator [Acidimicrobiales bacterium]